MNDANQTQSPEPAWTPEPWLVNIANLHLTEAISMREALDERINDTRSRSLSLLGMIGTALTIAAAIGSDLYQPAWLAISTACFGLGLLFALWCQKPRDYLPGPDITTFMQDEFTAQQPEALAVRDLTHEIYGIRAANADVVLKPVLKSFQRQTLFLGLAVLSLLISAAININSDKDQHDPEAAAPATPTATPSTD